MRVPVVGLLGRTGGRRELVAAVDPAEFGDDPWGGGVEGVEGPVDLDLMLEAVSDGILVRGDVAAVLRIPCARCLAPTRRARRVGVTELHRRTLRGPEGRRRGDVDEDDALEDDEAYALVEGDAALELDRMVRDALLLDVPVRVLCRPDCAGLCPTCGADRNVAPCAHGDRPAGDPRWAALDALRDRLAADESGAAGPGPDGPAGRG